MGTVVFAVQGPEDLLTFSDTGGPLLMLFFKTLEKQPSKQKTLEEE